MTGPRHDGGTRIDGRVGAGHAAVEPGHELDDLLSNWARSRAGGGGPAAQQPAAAGRSGRHGASELDGVEDRDSRHHGDPGRSRSESPAPAGRPQPTGSGPDRYRAERQADDEWANRVGAAGQDGYDSRDGSDSQNGYDRRDAYHGQHGQDRVGQVGQVGRHRQVGSDDLYDQDDHFGQVGQAGQDARHGPVGDGQVGNRQVGRGPVGHGPVGPEARYGEVGRGPVGHGQVGLGGPAARYGDVGHGQVGRLGQAGWQQSDGAGGGPGVEAAGWLDHPSFPGGYGGHGPVDPRDYPDGLAAAPPPPTRGSAGRGGLVGPVLSGGPAGPAGWPSPSAAAPEGPTEAAAVGWPRAPLPGQEPDPGLLTHRTAFHPDAEPFESLAAQLAPSALWPAAPGAPGPPGTGLDGPADPDDPADSDPDPGRRHRRQRRGTKRRRRWVRVVGWTGAAIGILVAAIGGYTFYEYHHLSGNIRRIDALAPRDPAIKEAARQLNAENFLLIGSDSRAGANAKYENTPNQVSGARSDTTILAHLSPDRGKALLVSIPRDAWVDIPPCRQPDGTMTADQQGQFNAAFSIGGAQCTVRTVQRMTGVQINHYVEVDFTGFKSMVDAIGGVPVCTTQPLSDKESGLRLDPGTTKVGGDQALAFVRARYNIGDGSDLGRIKRQQQFLGAMMRTVTSSGVILNPLKLTRFLEAATKALTLDKQTSFGDLKNLASQVRGLDPKKVAFLTAPIANADYTPPGYTGGGRVLLDPVAGGLLWESMINDKPAPAAGPKSKTPAPAPSPPKITVAAGSVSVQVLNGVGAPGLARKVGSDLSADGFTVAGTGNGPAGTTASIVRYPPAQLDAARTLAAAVPGSVLQPDAGLGPTLDLLVGANYAGTKAVAVGDPAPTGSQAPAGAATPATPSGPPLPSTSAAQVVCT